MATSSATVAALIVPHGKIVDYIDKTLRDDTPEEYVRQQIEKSIVREYQYAPEDIAVEFSVKLGTARKRVDLAIFHEGDGRKQENIWAIIECKAADVPRNHKTEGIEQLKSYMAACVNAEFGLWTNGAGDRFCCRKVVTPKGITFQDDLADIPVKGRTLDDAEKPTRATLKEATTDALLFTFKRCHNYIAGNQGLQKPEAFWELLKIIFCKITDERSDDIQFYATSTERQSLNGQSKVKSRIDKLFADVKENYKSIFKANDEVELSSPACWRTSLPSSRRTLCSRAPSM